MKWLCEQKKRCSVGVPSGDRLKIHQAPGKSLSVDRATGRESCCAERKCPSATAPALESPSIWTMQRSFSFRLFNSEAEGKSHVKIFSSWFTSEEPGNSGRREKSSAIIQAQLQMSTALLYGWTSSTSGARYHSVTTCWVNRIASRQHMHVRKLNWCKYSRQTLASFRSRKFWPDRNRPAWCARRPRRASFAVSNRGEWSDENEGNRRPSSFPSRISAIDKEKKMISKREEAHTKQIS